MRIVASFASWTVLADLQILEREASRGAEHLEIKMLTVPKIGLKPL